MAAILSIDRLSKHFGGLAAVDNVSFEVKEGEVLGLIGPNGAGKSTLINLISGTFQANGGTVKFKDEDITSMPTYRSAHKGLVRTFQLDVSFGHVSVYAHMYLACLRALNTSYQGIFFSTPSARQKQEQAKRDALELLALMHLTPHAYVIPRMMPHGFQRWLGVGMALALKPSLLLLDEPLSGMNAGEIDDTLALLRKIKQERGLSILIVEHNMRAVMSFCDRIVVIHYGQKICEGTPAVVSKDPAVIEAYLGGEHGHAA